MSDAVFAETQKYAIKIIVDNYSSSGVIFSNGNEDNIYVLTSLHSIEGFFEDGKHNNIIFRYYYDKEYVDYCCGSTVPKYCCLAEKNEGTIDWKKCKGTEKDIVLISLPKDSFGKELSFQSINLCDEKNDINVGDRLFGSGFPNDNCYLNNLVATFESYNGKRYVFENNNNNIRSFEDYMHGYSGCGLFKCDSQKKLKLSCIITGCDEETENNCFFAVPVNDIINEAKNQGWDIVTEESIISLNSFIEPTVDMISTLRYDARDYLSSAIDELISENGLEISSFFAENKQDKFSEYLCCNFKSITCQSYWTGQLIKAVCFCKIGGKNIRELHNLRVDIESDKDISIEYICTSKSAEEFIKDILIGKSNMTKGIIEDGSLFLWNGKKDAMYDDFVNRECVNGILFNVVANQNHTSLSSSGEKKVREAGYDIVNGEIPYFNFAVVGVQKLASTVIAEGDGKKDKMMEKLEEILKNAWSK